MDERMQEERLPIKVLRAEGSIENAGILLTPAEPQIGLDETHLMCVNGRGYIILDLPFRSDHAPQIHRFAGAFFARNARLSR